MVISSNGPVSETDFATVRSIHSCPCLACYFQLLHVFLIFSNSAFALQVPWCPTEGSRASVLLWRSTSPSQTVAHIQRQENLSKSGLDSRTPVIAASGSLIPTTELLVFSAEYEQLAVCSVLVTQPKKRKVGLFKMESDHSSQVNKKSMWKKASQPARVRLSAPALCSRL